MEDALRKLHDYSHLGTRDLAQLMIVEWEASRHPGRGQGPAGDGEGGTEAGRVSRRRYGLRPNYPLATWRLLAVCDLVVAASSWFTDFRTA